MAKDMLTISDRIQHKLDDLTRAERQLALSILENYPASGLGPLTALAKDADVSVPTVARMVQKLGYKGYPEFQSELREELRAKAKSPIAKHDTWAEAAPSGHMLNRFTDAVIDNIRHTLGQIDPHAFDAACALAGDAGRHLYIVGGRITHTLAEYLFLHMQVIRPNLTHVQSTSNSWPHYLLNAQQGDVFIIFDVRRYENNTLKLAEMAHARGARDYPLYRPMAQPRAPACGAQFFQPDRGALGLGFRRDDDAAGRDDDRRRAEPALGQAPRRGWRSWKKCSTRRDCFASLHDAPTDAV